MICPNCQSENRDDAKFCDQCGTKFTVPADMDAEVQTSDSDVDSNLDEAPEPDIDECEPQSDSILPDLPKMESPEPPLDPEFINQLSSDEPFDNLAEAQDSDAKDSDTDEALLHEGGDENEVSSEADELDNDNDQSEVTSEIPAIEDVSEEDEVLGSQDFSGLTFADFKPETPAYEGDAGDTLKMPSIGSGNAGSKQTNFVAPGDEKSAKKQKKQQVKQAKQQLKESKKAANPEKGKKISKGIIVAMVCVLVLAAIAVAAAGLSYCLEVWGGKTVPDVVGMTQTDATYLLESKGFTVRTTQVASDDTEGLVLLADPGSGTREPEGTEIVLHVAISRVIPAIDGLSHDEAIAALTEAGYENVSVTKQKSDEDDGKVLSVSPAVGSKTKSSTKVELVEAESYKVPEVLGMTWDQAKSAIESEGFTAYYAEEYNENVTPGTVLYTTPEENSSVKSGSAITVVVAKSRSSEVVSLARSVLPGMVLTLNDGSSYTVNSVVAVSYEGSDTCSFTVNGTATREVTLGSATATVTAESTESGAISFNSANEVTSCAINS